MPQVHLGELLILHPHSKAPKSIGTSGSEEARPEREDLVCQNRMETAGYIAWIFVAFFSVDDSQAPILQPDHWLTCHHNGAKRYEINEENH